MESMIKYNTDTELVNFNMYGIYGDLLLGKELVIHTNILSKDNIMMHYNYVLNIFRDGIETETVQQSFVTICFDADGGETCQFSLSDYFINLIMWYMILHADTEIRCSHIYFNKAVNRGNIKEYIDDKFIDPYRGIIENRRMCNIIDDSLYLMIVIDDFSWYFANSMDLRCITELMEQYDEFFNLAHLDLSNCKLEDIKNKGMEATNRMVSIILQHPENTLYYYLLSGECINKKQLKEVICNIGTKPNGQRGIYPTCVNNSFINGGTNTPLNYLIESGNGRIAQTIVEGNVGTSGYFAWLLGLNTGDTFLNHDEAYICDSKNFQVLEVKNEAMASRLINRYYRLKPNGLEYIISKKNYTFLVGKTIYLRSPMTCASAARGEGLCHRCYGKLSHTNRDINVGKIASEIMSAFLTQMMLSAKHLLESNVRTLKWLADFDKFLIVNYNIISLNDIDLELERYNLVINRESILLENEVDEYSEYNGYINSCTIVDNVTGQSYVIATKDNDNLYLSSDINEIISNYPADEDIIVIPLITLKDNQIFLIKLHNNELSRTLEKITHIINNSATTKQYDRHGLLQALLETVIEGKLGVDSVHLEIILQNQLRNVDDILDTPEWEYPDEPSTVITLGNALTNNPSVTNSLLYENVNKALFNHNTYKKNKASIMDLYFMEQPQEFLKDTDEITKSKIEDNNEIKQAIRFFNLDEITESDASSEDDYFYEGEEE